MYPHGAAGWRAYSRSARRGVRGRLAGRLRQLGMCQPSLPTQPRRVGLGVWGSGFRVSGFRFRETCSVLSGRFGFAPLPSDERGLAPRVLDLALMVVGADDERLVVCGR